MYNCLAPNSETNQLIRQPNCSFKGPLNLISEYGRRKKYEHEKKILYFEGVRILEQVAQRGCGCLLWRYPKSSWMFSFATYFRECALAGNWTRWFPSNPYNSVILRFCNKVNVSMRWWRSQFSNMKGEYSSGYTQLPSSGSLEGAW